ncbi:MAG: hypothetical protein GWO38_31370, partial [Phycisphaerae bacterium]|nr:hypothetical protein [Phycisphaerae bacterium]NIX32004.1 hypothetical protein [Phycisphaerae bacterium]
QLQGGRGEIIDAAISPLITRRDDALGATARDLGRRGVSGSLRGDALANVDTRFGEAIADARGRATSQQVASEAGLFQLIDALNQEELAQELSSLGLSSAAISAALAGGARKGTASSFDPAGSIGNLLFGVGSILP